MAMRKQGDVFLGVMNFGDNTIDPCAHLLRRFAAGAAITKNHPVRSFCQNLLGSKTFVFTVIPLQKVSLDLSAVPEPSQFAGFACAVERAGENQREGLLGE